MPRKPNPNAGQSTELVFPDSLEGLEFQVREALLYSAEEVREETGSDVPEFGDWIPVRTKVNGTMQDGWMVGLSELDQWLANTENPESGIWVISRAEKSGTSQTDPYEINVEKLDQSDQGRLD